MQYPDRVFPLIHLTQYLNIVRNKVCHQGGIWPNLTRLVLKEATGLIRLQSHGGIRAFVVCFAQNLTTYNPFSLVTFASLMQAQERERERESVIQLQLRFFDLLSRFLGLAIRICSIPTHQLNSLKIFCPCLLKWSWRSWQRHRVRVLPMVMQHISKSVDSIEKRRN